MLIMIIRESKDVCLASLISAQTIIFSTIATEANLYNHSKTSPINLVDNNSNTMSLVKKDDH